MTKDDFNNYLNLFNTRQYDAFPEYYSEDIEYVMDAQQGKVFRGCQAIADLYRSLHEHFDEKIHLVDYALSDTLLATEVLALLRARKPFDVEGFIPIPEGKILRMTTFNHFTA